MDIEQLKDLENKDPEKFVPILESFNEKNANLFIFTDFHLDGLWLRLWRNLFTILKDKSLSDHHPLCLNTVRLLTRDEFGLQNFNVTSDIDILIDLAELSTSDNMMEMEQTPVEEKSTESDSFSDKGAAALVPISSSIDTIVECLKCLCNLVFQNAAIRKHCLKSNIIDSLMKRLSSNAPEKCSSLLELYDLKFLFLMTALETDGRTQMLIDLDAVSYLTEWLDEKLVDGPLTEDKHMDCLCEMLKILFNVTSSEDMNSNADEIQSLRLAGVLREILLRFGLMRNDKERQVVTQTINLLTNISQICLTELILKQETDPTTAAPTTTNIQHLFIFEGFNVYALDMILRYLHFMLAEQQMTASTTETIAPVLTVLIKCARCNRQMRHFIRKIILPPLVDATQRPEVGNDIRNHLCRFLTNPSVLIRNLSSELLFICCKENVSRMVKYTGYGNAAGLLAQRGLLDCRKVENTDYSSDSEDSDTEEYRMQQQNIDPVVGSVMPPRKSPFEGMSEERKEYEAMELVKLMDKLHSSGVLQPCRIGEDGKPQPVDHILELQEELPQQAFEQKRKT